MSRVVWGARLTGIWSGVVRRVGHQVPGHEVPGHQVPGSAVGPGVLAEKILELVRDRFGNGIGFGGRGILCSRKKIK